VDFYLLNSFRERVQFDRLREVSDDDKSFAQELVVMYKQSSEENLPKLRKALIEQNKEDSVLYSHDIKGSSANLGAESAKKVSEKIEMFCRDENYAEALNLLPRLEKELQ
jgi:HPt (histidine-containing phosphotransfer) domain-containing protein